MAKSAADLLKKHKASRKANTEANKQLKSRKNWYPTTMTKQHFSRKCRVPRACNKYSNFKPGQIVILLSGRFRGRRVVFLKKLETGLLLVTGPYKINGVPLKRVNPAYVLPTSTSIKLGNIKEVDSINNEFFKKVSVKRENEKDFFEEPAKKKERITEERTKAQQAIDTVVKKGVDEVKMMKEYLRNRFALKNGDKPHLMKF